MTILSIILIILFAFFNLLLIVNLVYTVKQNKALSVSNALLAMLAFSDSEPDDDNYVRPLTIVKSDDKKESEPTLAE